MWILQFVELTLFIHWSGQGLKKGDLKPCLCVVVTSRYLASDSLSEIIKGMNVGTSVRGAVPVDTKYQQFEFRSSM